MFWFFWLGWFFVCLWRSRCIDWLNIVFWRRNYGNVGMGGGWSFWDDVDSFYIWFGNRLNIFCFCKDGDWYYCFWNWFCSGSKNELIWEILGGNYICDSVYLFWWGWFVCFVEVFWGWFDIGDLWIGWCFGCWWGDVERWWVWVVYKVFWV